MNIGLILMILSTIGCYVWLFELDNLFMFFLLSAITLYILKGIKIK